MIKELGRVTGFRLGLESHGILTLYIDLKFDAGGQSFGGYFLDTYDANLQRRVGTAAGTDFILRVLKLFKVDTLEEIKGRIVYALLEKSKIEGLEIPVFDGGGTFLVSDWQDQWFSKEQP